jgi:predicted PurR-regulated permease PerM
LAVLWAIGEMVPGIGPFIYGIPSIVLGFMAGPEIGSVATIFTFIWSQIENSSVLVPRIMSRAVKLNPLVVLVTLLAGSELLGLAGAVFSIPAAAALAIIVAELHQERLHAQELDGTALDASHPPSELQSVVGP